MENPVTHRMGRGMEGGCCGFEAPQQAGVNPEPHSAGGRLGSRGVKGGGWSCRSSSGNFLKVTSCADSAGAGPLLLLAHGGHETTPPDWACREPRGPRVRPERHLPSQGPVGGEKVTVPVLCLLTSHPCPVYHRGLSPQNLCKQSVNRVFTPFVQCSENRK